MFNGNRGEGWVAAQAALLAAYRGLPVVLPYGTAGGVGWSSSGYMLVVVAAVILVTSAIPLGSSLTPMLKPCQERELVAAGLYRVDLHPVYFAVIVEAIGFSLMSVSWSRLD